MHKTSHNLHVMQIKINALIPAKNRSHWIQVFGYTSKSQPGLEINGLNGRGRAIKEKLTFLSKKRRLRYPLKRFVLCVEGEGLEQGELEYLELPLLLCFWSLADILPLGKLDNCFAAGKISLEGEISFPEEDGDYLKRVDDYLKVKRRHAIRFGGALDIPLDRIHRLCPVELLNEEVGDFSQIDNALARSTN